MLIGRWKSKDKSSSKGSSGSSGGGGGKKKRKFGREGKKCRRSPGSFKLSLSPRYIRAYLCYMFYNTS